MTLRIEVDAQEYYRSKRFRCPSCAAVSVVSAPDDRAVRATDFGFDRCEPCGMVIVVENSRATLARGKVAFMAFPSVIEAISAVTGIKMNIAQ
jgi:hypothetical protein